MRTIIWWFMVGLLAVGWAFFAHGEWANAAVFFLLSIIIGTSLWLTDSKK